MSLMVNLRIGFKEPLTRPGIKKHLLFDLATQRIYKFQLARRCCDSEKISCYAILKNVYELEMDVILTICFKITADIEISKHMFCILLCRRGNVSQGAKKIIFTAFHSGMLKLAFTSPDVILTSPKNFLFFCYSNSS